MPFQDEPIFNGQLVSEGPFASDGGWYLSEGVRPSLHDHAGKLAEGCVVHRGSMDLWNLTMLTRMSRSISFWLSVLGSLERVSSSAMDDLG